MKNNSRNSGTYTSPGTPEYGDNHMSGFQKGWCSERVPLPSNSSRRHISATALMPFNSGRTVPSKWDDAERWITSPVAWKTPNGQFYRRPKSRSGPLGGMYYSPSLPGSNFVANSPFTTGVLVPNGVSIHYGAQNSMARTTSVPGLSDLFSESSVPSSPDDDTKDPYSVCSIVSKRDMATQMSPDSTSSSIPSGVEQNEQAKVEIRDVQVDKGIPISGQSREMKRRKELPDVSDSISPWNAAKSMSKSEREEARITAWENLQKAKAEAAIQKLEMKLEKRRSASMNKIRNKLRLTELKAEEMKRAISEDRTSHSERNTRRIIPHRRYFKIASFSSCFACGIR